MHQQQPALLPLQQKKQELEHQRFTAAIAGMVAISAGMALHPR